MSKDTAQRKISKSRLPEESNHITDLEATSKLPGKLFEKPANMSNPAASERSFKGWHLGPVIVIQRDIVVRYSGINSIPIKHTHTHRFSSHSPYVFRERYAVHGLEL